MEAVYIYDQTGRTVLTYPSLATLSAAKIRAAVIAPKDEPTAPALLEITPSQLVYVRPYQRLLLAVPCASTIRPLVVEEFVGRLIAVLEEYFDDKLTLPLVEANHSAIMQLLYEMLEAGLPHITEPDLLRGLVPSGNLFQKLLAAPKQGLPAWDIPWRRPAVKHTKNQLYVDVDESLTVLVPPQDGKQRRSGGSAFYSMNSTIQSRPSTLRVKGQVLVNSHLSGVPTVHLELDLPAKQAKSLRPSFHACVDRKQWADRGLLAFVPPEGRTVVAQYTLEVPDQGLVYGELKRGLGDDKSQFEVRVSTNMDTLVESVDNLCVTIVFPQGTKNVKELRLSNGDLDVSDPTKGLWTFGPRTPVGWHATLRGQAFDDDSKPVSPQYLQVKYSLIGRVPSRTSVRNLNIVNWKEGGDRPYRGVRYQTHVDNFIVR